MKSSTLVAALAAVALLSLAACGGGGEEESLPRTQLPPVEPEEPTVGPVDPVDPGEPMTEPVEPIGEQPQFTTLEGFEQWEFNIYAFDPQTDLPSNGTNGMRVSRPQGAKVYINLEYAPGIEALLEGPYWMYDDAALERLDLAAIFLETAIWTGYKQWARHLDGTYTVDVLVGHQGIASCGHSAVACYLPDLDAVVFGDQWLIDNYYKLHVGRELGIEGTETAVFSEMVFVATHEAAHQFGYRHPSGDSAGCGESTRCHGPIGSGSVTSYDTLRGGTSRYAPDREDVRHIVGGSWNPNEFDLYKVWKAPAVPAILEYGYWLLHDFAIEGSTAPGQPSEGTFGVLNVVTVEPFITGTPSPAHELRGNASWSGDFLGYDLLPNRMTALTADVALAYSFNTRTMDLAVYDFYSWVGDEPEFIGERYEYGMTCTSASCSYERAGTPCLGGTATCGAVSVQTRFYADGGDPSAYTGGVVNDDAEKYAGAFAAEKR